MQLMSALASTGSLELEYDRQKVCPVTFQLLPLFSKRFQMDTWDPKDWGHVPAGYLRTHFVLRFVWESKLHHTELLLHVVLLCTYCYLLHSSLTSCAELCFLSVVFGTPNDMTWFCQSELEVGEDLQCVTASSSLLSPLLCPAPAPRAQIVGRGRWG